MIKNSLLSDYSLISSKKAPPSAHKRTRAEFETDYRQAITKSPQKGSIGAYFLTTLPSLQPIKDEVVPILPSKQEMFPGNEIKQKAMEANLNLPQTSHNDAYVNQIKQKMLLKSDLIHKCKRVSEKVDIYLEQDEKYADTKMLKDEKKSINDEYECFDSDYYFFNSLQFPACFHDFFEENKAPQPNVRVLKGVFTDINCVYLVVDRSLYLWRYMEESSQTDELKLDSIYSQAIHKTEPKIFSFGPYEEEIRAVSVCRPSAYIFVQSDIKLVFVIGFVNKIQLYKLKIDEKSIALDSLDSEVKLHGEIDTIVCSKTGRVFYGCTNGKIKEIDYQESKILGLIPYKKGFYSKDCKKTLKSHIKDYLVSTYSIFAPPKYLKMISIDNTRYILYALLETGHQSENSEIVVYDLGVKNDSFQKIFTITTGLLKQKIKNQGQKFDFADTELKIISISSLDETHSKDLNLLLITKNGLRLFLQFHTRVQSTIEPYLSKFVSLDRPIDNFEIVFVKWPIILANKKNVGHGGLLMDKHSTVASTQQSRKMVTGFLDKNCCLMVESNDHNTMKDDIPYKTIYFYSVNPLKTAINEENSKQLMENAGIIKISTDHYYDDVEISKIPEKSLVSSSTASLLDLPKNGVLINKEFLFNGKTGSLAYNSLPDIIRQVYLPASHYVFLTSESLDFVLKARPIDFLFQILHISPPEAMIDEYEFNKFVNCFGGVETCCMLLEIICNGDMVYFFNETLDKKLKEEYIARINQNDRNRLSPNTENKKSVKCLKASEEIIKKAVLVFFKLGDSIQETKNESGERRDFYEAYGKVIQPERKKYTFKIEAFILYFSRLIRPVWNKKLVEKSVFECLIYDRFENFSEEELKLVRKRISEIRNFINSKNEKLLIRNVQNLEEKRKSERKNILEFSNRNLGPLEKQENSASQNKIKGNVEEIIWDEKKFLEDYYVFLEKIIQTIDLLIFFMMSPQFNFKKILSMVPIFDRDSFLNLTFSDFFRELNAEKSIKSLITAILKTNLPESKIIMNHALATFPGFYNEFDAKISEAEQLFEIAMKHAKEPAEKEELIQKAIIRIHDNIHILTDEQIESLYKTYLEPFGKFGESINLLVHYINNMNLLEEGLKISQRERTEKKQTFGNKIDFFLHNIQSYKESSRNLILQIITKVLITKNYLINKKIISFTHNDHIIKNINLEDSYALFEKCLLEVFKSSDENLHKTVLRWLFDQKLFENILKVESRFVEDVLKEETDKNFKEKYMTLYKYYINKGEHLKASKTAVKICDCDQADVMNSTNSSNDGREFIIPEQDVIGIEERIKFMNFAIQELSNHLETLDAKEQNYKNIMQNKNDLAFLLQHLKIQSKVIQELEELLEETNNLIAFYSSNRETNIEVLQKLHREKNDFLFKIQFLNRKFIDMDQLKIEFIDPFAMLSCKLLLRDYADNSINNSEVEAIYNAIFKNISDTTANNNLWTVKIQQKLKDIYFNLCRKRRRLFPIEIIIPLLENYNQTHPCFSGYLDRVSSIIENRDPKWPEDLQSKSPFWIVEFLHSKLNIPIFDILTQYEKYFTENNNQYDKEAETPEFKVNTIIQLMYSLNAGIYALDFTFRVIERDIQTIVLGTGGKGQVSECLKNAKMFQEKAGDIDSLLFAFFEKVEILKKNNQSQMPLLNNLAAIVHRLKHESLKRIKDKINLITFAQEEVEEKNLENMKESQVFKDSLFPVEQDMLFLNQSFNAEEESGKKDKEKRLSKYNLSVAPI